MQPSSCRFLEIPHSLSLTSIPNIRSRVTSPGVVAILSPSLSCLAQMLIAYWVYNVRSPMILLAHFVMGPPQLPPHSRHCVREWRTRRFWGHRQASPSAQCRARACADRCRATTSRCNVRDVHACRWAKNLTGYCAYYHRHVQTVRNHDGRKSGEGTLDCGLHGHLSPRAA